MILNHAANTVQSKAFYNTLNTLKPGGRDICTVVDYASKEHLKFTRDQCMGGYIVDQ